MEKRGISLIAINDVKQSYTDKHGNIMLLCKCVCGNEFLVRKAHLKSGNTKSCGCLTRDLLKKRNKTHGLSKTQLYTVWGGIKNRCFNRNHCSFGNYGGRGIGVCDEWRKDFKSFYDWAMAHGYKQGLQIDRIDNDGNYEPSNCRWVTRKENCKNRRNKVFETANKKTES